MNYSEHQMHIQKKTVDLFFSHSKTVALTVLASFALAPQVPAAQSVSTPGDKTNLQSSTENEIVEKTKNNDAFLQEDMPLSPLKEKYLKSMIKNAFDPNQVIKSPPYTRDWIYMEMHVFKYEYNYNFCLGEHIELGDYADEICDIFEKECHEDIPTFKNKLKSLLSDNEEKKQRWDGYLNAHPEEKAKLNKSSINFNINRKTKLPVLEEIYLNHLIADAEHPDFDYIDRYYAPRWLASYADQMKKSSGCTPEKSKEIDRILKKYSNILSSDCKKDPMKFKTKIREMYKKVKIQTE